MDFSHPQILNLCDKIEELFTIREIETLTRLLDGFKWDEIKREGSFKLTIIELVSYAKRHQKLAELVAELKKQRPKTSWAEFESEGFTYTTQKQQVSNYQKDLIDFVIITIREDEHSAILKRFPPKRIFDGKNRSYSIYTMPLDTSEGYNFAVIRSIEQGNNSAQDVARDAIEDLDPQWIILVGIAGAIPAAEFTLGDVIVTSRLVDFSVRAVTEDGEEYATMGGPMHKQVQDKIALIPALSHQLANWNSPESIGMSRPIVKIEDSLFYGEENWQKDVKKYMNFHFGINAIQRNPLVTTGTIISANTLVKDTKIMNLWKTTARQVVSVEMELGGVYVAARRTNKEYPILAIRGISDIIGFKRDPAFTEYACQTAAAFAYAFLKTKPIKPKNS